jgi:hypothetical protein
MIILKRDGRGKKGYLVFGYNLKRVIADARGYHCDNVAKRKVTKPCRRGFGPGGIEVLPF